jgi:glycosyltransferase involved in cell wall biosynthesis
MNRLSIVTVVKNDLSALKLTRLSIKTLQFPHEWIVIDGGSDLETVEWMKTEKKSNVAYLRETDKNLYEAMNKGIKLSTGSHLIFVNAGDLLNESKKLANVLENLSIDDGFIGCIRRKNRQNKTQYYIVKPQKYAFFYSRYGIFPISHQATIYPRNFILYHPYDVNAGVSADQISILKLLKDRKTHMDYSLVVCDFKNGGIGDTQKRGAFFKEMFFSRCRNASRAKLILELILIFPIFLFKLGFSISNRLRRLRVR